MPCLRPYTTCSCGWTRGRTAAGRSRTRVSRRCATFIASVVSCASWNSLSLSLSWSLFVCLRFCLSVRPSVRPSVCLSVCLRRNALARQDGVHQSDFNPNKVTDESLSEGIKRLKPLIMVELIEKLQMDQAIVFVRTQLDCYNLEQFLLS